MPNLNIPGNWLFRGMRLISEDDPHALENTKIAISLADTIRKDIDFRLDVSAWGPDGETRAPANAHGRALIRIITTSRSSAPIALIVFEEGAAHLFILVADMLDETGTFELSDPGFPATVLNMLYKHLTPHLGWEPKYERGISDS
jgi:hypothetical protein